jgi:putative mRNA 3-end processing factor
MLLQFDKDGIYCEQAGIYIDPWKPVDKAIITHAHSDHARWGSKSYLAHHDSRGILNYRLGSDIQLETLDYNEPVTMNGVRISLHPAGHITGSAQVRLEYKGEVWVVSGDYKVMPDGITVPFESVPCHHFVTESTFGLPIYNFPEAAALDADLKSWCLKNLNAGKSCVIIGYSLGKAQRILNGVDELQAPVMLHGAIYNTNAALGLSNERYLRYAAGIKKTLHEPVIVVAPPSVIGSSWLRQFEPYELGVCSGWMQLRGARRRRNADMGFVMSDHADWKGLNEAVLATGAEHIYVTHGYKSIYAKWLQEQFGLNAMTVDTLYEGEALEQQDTETTKEEDEAA